MEVIPDLFSNNWYFRNENHAFWTSTNNLTKEQQEKLKQIVDEAFASVDGKLGSTSVVKHVIKIAILLFDSVIIITSCSIISERIVSVNTQEWYFRTMNFSMGFVNTSS